MARAFAEIAFTPDVLDMQSRQGSAEAYRDFMDPSADTRNRLTENERGFIQARDGFYQATTSSTGWPYMQFRGGPAGFAKVLDDQHIAYADFRGNRQYVSTGNIHANSKIFLFFMDYPNRRRLKVWGHAKIVERDEDPQLIASLQMENYRAFPERAIIINVAALDWNCPQHIPQRLTEEEFAPHIADLKQQLHDANKQNLELKNQLSKLL